MLYDYLKENYELGEPIFVEDLSSVCSDALSKLNELVSEGKLRSFNEVYYFPEINKRGELPLVSDTYVQYKYLYRNGERIGYFAGFTLANMLGVSTQVPYVTEIISNLATTDGNMIILSKRRFIVSKPFTKITNKNVQAQMVLSCINDIDKCAEYDDNVCGEILTRYAKRCNITQKDVNSVIKSYPSDIFDKIERIGVKFVTT